MILLAAEVSAVSNLMHGLIAPLVYGLGLIASLVCTLCLVAGGLSYMTSSGQPDRLARAKRIIRNSMVGLIIVISAAALTAILNHAYVASAGQPTNQIPSLISLQPASSSSGIIGLIVKAIVGVLESIVESIASPFISALASFTSGTPLMASNPSVFNFWLASVAMADGLFVLVLTLIGFKVMSHEVLGLDEFNIGHLLPQLALTFLLVNSSIFAIDTLISLSNGLIDILHKTFGNLTIWQALEDITKKSSSLGIAALLITVVFLVLAVMLLVYYVGRIVTLYLGAILAPFLILLWLLPSFKDFATGAVKTYFSTIFVLFIHVVILELAASIFLVIANGQSANSLMALIVAISTLVALLKTQGVLSQLTYASIGPRTARRLGSQFVNSLSYTAARIKEGMTA